MGYYVKHTQTLSPPPPPPSLILSGMRRHCHTIANTFLVDFEHRKITNCSSYPPTRSTFFFFRQSVAPSHPSNVETHTDISLPKYITRNTHICVCAPILYVRHTIRVTYISHANFERQKNLGNNLKVFTSRLQIKTLLRIN